MKKWKIVYWIALLFFIKDLVVAPFSKDIGWIGTVSLIFKGFSLFPLYGYSYQVAVGTRFFAIAIFALNAIGYFAISIYLIYSFIVYISVAQFVASGFAVCLLILLIVPQFRYAFRSDYLWYTRRTPGH